MDLQSTEIELKKRLTYPYKWGRKQSNALDKKTNFIYNTESFNILLKRIESLNQTLKDYALNRWFNFWSAKVVESIFVAHENVLSNKNTYDKLIDFKINNIPFDHKTSKFPIGFNQSYTNARKSEKELIRWLYDNQSQQGRKHLKNRLFILLYDGKTKEHWKLKSELKLIKSAIDDYVKSFSINKLYSFDFGEGKVLAGIIWIVKDVD